MMRTIVTRASWTGRHLKPRPKKRGPLVVGAAAAVWIAPSGAAAKSVLVKPGDTLSDIAARTGTTVDALASANGIQDKNRIYAGSRLTLPRGAAAQLSPSKVVTVAPGDTLSGIAGRFGISVEALAKANGIADPNFVAAGQKLVIPGGGAATATGVEGMLEQEALAQGVDPALVKAVAWQESGWNQKARSHAGAIGVMQVMPATAAYVNQVLGTGNLRVRKAPDNIRLGVTYLRHQLNQMGSERKALAAYYSGPGNVGRRLKKYQRRYVDAVQAHRSRFVGGG